MGLNYVSIDLETTGLNEDTCDVLEFAAVLDNLSDLKPLDQLPVFHTYFVKDKYIGEPVAFSMHSEIFKRIAERDIKKYNFMSATKIGGQFRKFLVKNGYKEEKDRVTINVAGKNFAAFDLQFLNRQTDLAKHVKIRHKILDPAILYYQDSDEALPGLEECKKRAGLDSTVAHNALDDARDVIRLLRKKLGSIK